MDPERRARVREERLLRLRAGYADYKLKGGKFGPKVGKGRSRDDVARYERDVAKAAVANGSATLVPVVRDHHHRIARLVASGLTTSQIAAAVGLGISRISQLRQDQVMVALIAKYGERYDAIDEEMYATRRMKEELILHHALDGMIEKYELSPHEISHEQRRLDYALVTERLDGQVVKPSVVLHGNVSDMPLADLVRLQRARADKMLAEIKPDDGSLPVVVSADTGSGPVESDAAALPTPVPASTSDADASKGNGEGND
jgi:hypothetical protein